MTTTTDRAHNAAAKLQELARFEADRANEARAAHFHDAADAHFAKRDAHLDAMMRINALRAAYTNARKALDALEGIERGRAPLHTGGEFVAALEREINLAANDAERKRAAVCY